MRLPVALAALLCLATLLSHAPARDNEFLLWDDDIYVTRNPPVAAGISKDGALWAFTSIHAGYWIPLTWLSHMLDVELFGLDSRAHHLTNVVLHAFDAVLLFAVLLSLTGAPWRCALVAAIFALHPMQVENVAWVTERKTLLSTGFGLACIAAWSRYARSGSRAALLASAVAFAASLLCKPALVTLPCVLLLLDFWPLRRISSFDLATSWKLLREKLGLLALALASSAITLITHSPGFIQVAPSARLANALVSYPRYLAGLLWPQHLAALYPYPEHWPVLFVTGACALLLLVTLFALWQARRRPWLIVGWLWFCITLVPTLGLVQVGVQSMADRFVYVPIIGLALALVWSAAELLERTRVPVGARAALALCMLLALAAATRTQLAYWKDTVTLFERAVSVTRANVVAETELGIALAARGELEPAIEHLRNAVALNPEWPRANANLGWALVERDELAAGIDHLERALRAQPDLRNGAYTLGLALARAGRIEEATARLREQLALDPTHAGARRALKRLQHTPPGSLEHPPSPERK